MTLKYKDRIKYIYKVMSSDLQKIMKLKYLNKEKEEPCLYTVIYKIPQNHKIFGDFKFCTVLFIKPSPKSSLQMHWISVRFYVI